MKSLPPLLLILLLCPVVIASAADEHEFFENRIRPVLVKHCYECHSAESKAVKGGLLLDSAPAMLAGGDSGPTLVKHKPEESTLIEALKFESFEMPPAGKLPDRVIADFEKWIKMGAPDPRREMIEAEYESKGIDLEAGRQFWAFQPPEAHVVPKVAHEQWPNNWIDHFVLARLEENGIAPSEDAERGTLLRRIAYDLTGLPPRPEDVERVLYADDPRALKDYVDQLLNSAQFGEHWGRHWLDVVRYADSNGGDFNATFHNAYRYRDYVVETFNDDRPFDQFVIEQIAGDLMDAADRAERERNIVATGFLMLGTKMLSERDKEKLRMDVVDEQLNTIGKGFMGMTLGCARCHDHKFDPIPTKDYYAMAGILRSTQTLDGEIQKYVSNWTRQPLPMTPEQEAALKEHQAEIGRLDKAIKETQKNLEALKSKTNRDEILKQGILLDDTKARLTGDWTSSTYSKNFIGKGYIHDNKQNIGRKRVTFETSVPADGEYEVRLAFPGTSGRATKVPVRIVHASGESMVKVDQSKQAPILKMLKPLGRFEFKKDQPVVVEISNEKTDGYVIVDAIQLVSVKEVEAVKQSEDETLQPRITKLEQHLANQQKARKELDKQAPPPAPRALAVREAKQQGDYFVCIRGEPRNLGPKVSRGFLQVASFEDEPQIEADQSGRLAMAKWVADARNPLTARVYVNRVWHHLLGAGIVRSVDNFGTLGERPTHPELLDQLAYEFIEHKWSTKWLVREIVSSRTYQLSSRHDEQKWQQDPENRLLWRAHRKPLSAEEIRDTMLLATGELDLSRGGPPVSNLGTLVTQNKPDDEGVTLKANNLRTLYQPVIRNELPTMMKVFDFADPDFVSGKRAETTVPTQALWMLNSPMIAKQAKTLNERLAAAEYSTADERLEALYVRTMGRPPLPAEIELVMQTFGELDADDEAFWQDLAHALFASSAFRMLD